uniref:transposase n=1 Tax=Saccharicrinis fermentans TaxID=982 RepID=UPI0004B4C9E5
MPVERQAVLQNIVPGKGLPEKRCPKTVSLPGVEFLKRFCQHVMPKGFVRIRR